MPGKLYGVSLGPGDPKYLTLRAVEVLRRVDVIFTVVSPNADASTSRTVVESLAPLSAEIRTLEFSMDRRREIRRARIAENAGHILQMLRADRDCAFATLGDALTYSTFGYILKEVRKALPRLEIEIVPGVTSFAALASRSGHVLVENDAMLRVIPAFRKEMADTLDFPKGSTTVLMKTYHSRDALLQRLDKEDNLEVVYGERIGLDRSFISSDLATIRTRADEYLSLFLVHRN